MANRPENKLDKEALERATLIFEAYFGEKLEPATDEKIQGWLASGDSAAEKDAALKSLWMKTVAYDTAPGKYAQSSLVEMRALLGFPTGEKRRGPGRRIMLRVAAVLLPVLFIAGLAFVLTEPRDAQPGTVAQATAVTVTVEAAEDTEYVVLPDGSEVWIHEGGVISYSGDFERNRVVNLDGEAYFSVTRHEGIPFRVVGDGIDVKVLGTEFDVICYKGCEKAVVTLAKGSLEVTADERTVVLNPLDELIYDALAESMVITEVSRHGIGMWRIDRDWLVFEDTPLGEVFGAVSDRYGTPFAIDERLALDARIRAYFTGKDSLDEVMSVLEMTVGTFGYEIKEKMVVVTTR